ncbi:VOC family protein [Atopococcus tabaci]|uniref:VOC family protein n=1 Tax=Atopococcus tabaci TaxID=269774 RepID=UPI002409B2DF|nr:VOC family protein [Atopococcus tabaci]
MWSDTQAREAVEFYTTTMDNSRITSVQVMKDTPGGDSTSVGFELAEQPFMAISAGPYFKLNPSISLMVLCDTKEEIDRLWLALSEGGKELMPLQEYPFSRRYGWIVDRFGLTWQLDWTEEPIEQKIVPTFLFSNEASGKVEDAMKFYTEVIPNSKIEDVYPYEEGESENPNAKVQFASFRLNGMQFYAMDNGMNTSGDENLNFNEAFSLMIPCEGQKEIDYFWDKMSAVPEAEQCGWIKDKFGVSWQIAPDNLEELLSTGTPEQINNVVQTFLPMKKLDIATLEQAWNDAK